MVLSQADAKTVLDAASALFTLDGRTDFAAAVLEVIHLVIPCEIISYNEVDLSSGRTYAAVYPDRWVPVVESSMPIFESAVHDHPLVLHIAETGSRVALRLEDVVDDETLFQTKYYQDFLSGLLGLRHQMAIALPSPAWLTIGVALSRADPLTPFTDREVGLLNALAPHIAHSYQRAEIAKSHASLTDAIADNGWIAVTVDKNGIVNRIDGDLGPDVRVGEPAPEPLQQLLRSPRHDSLQAASGQPVSSAALNATMRVYTTAESDYLILVRQNGVELRTSLSEHGLTPRQIDAAEQLLVGGTNDHIALRLGISAGTLRKHLEALYRKLDVADRSSAIARIAAHARDSGAI